MSLPEDLMAQRLGYEQALAVAADADHDRAVEAWLVTAFEHFSAQPTLWNVPAASQRIRDTIATLRTPGRQQHWHAELARLGVATP